MAKKLKERYELIEELGKGGMGIVYRARDTELDRNVAIKLLPPQLSQDPTFLQRFEREAKAVTSLEHNNIVPVYDFGQDRNQTFLVMRLLKGGDLKKMIDHNPLALTEAIRILRQVGSALDKAHAHNIIHRDLKPGNILFDDDGNAFLGDFGIVKLTNESASFTQTGGTLGTPYYMSPEQIRDPQNIDHRTDLYSLGVILYEMLTGNLPYESDSSFDLQNMHVNNPIPSILEANSDLPDKVEDVIQKAMAKRREDRYSSAKEMLNDLEIAAAATAGAAPPPPTKETPPPEPVVITPTAELDPPAAVAQPEPAVGVAAIPTVSQGMANPVAAAPMPEPEPAASAVPAPAAATGSLPKWAYAAGGAVVALVLCIVIALLIPTEEETPDTTVNNSGGQAAAANQVDDADNESNNDSAENSPNTDNALNVFLDTVNSNSEPIVTDEEGELTFDSETYYPYYLGLNQENFSAHTLISDSDGNYVYGFMFRRTDDAHCDIYVEGRTAHLEYYDADGEGFQELGSYPLGGTYAVTPDSPMEMALIVWGDVALFGPLDMEEPIVMDISDCPAAGDVGPYVDLSEGSGSALATVSVDSLPAGDPPVRP